MKPVDLFPSLPTGAKILFIRMRSLGDTVLSTPLYAAVKLWRPDLQVFVLVESPNHEVLQNNPDVKQVIPISDSDSRDLGRLSVRFATLKTIRAMHFDCCINLHGGSTSAWLTALSGSKYRVGLGSFRNRFAYNLKIEVPPPTKPTGKTRHTVEYQIAWLRCLGLPEGPIPPLRVVPDSSLRIVSRDKLLNAGLGPTQNYAVIQPTSKFQTKEWTAEGFAEVADDLKARHAIQVIFVTGPGETARMERVIARCQSSPIVLHGISVSELVWVIQGARIFIGNDSGPTHIAAALQVPVVVLFGSSDSQVWYPWKAHCQIVQNEFECNPCPGYRCLVYDEPRCILSITPEQVKAAVNALLGSHRGRESP
jgi:predicted lipopolysaccharide heptosyltransferase III